MHEAFRAPLDISLDTRMDRAANQELAERLGRKPTAAERITRTVYTQGNPPAYAFSRGQLMHEPTIIHTLPNVLTSIFTNYTIISENLCFDKGKLFF